MTPAKKSAIFGCSSRLLRFFKTMRISPFPFVIALSFLVLSGCSTQILTSQVTPVQVEIMEPSPPPPQPEAIQYQDIADKLKRHAQVRGIDFYQNDTGNYMLYSIENKERFTIADKTGTCLYNVEVSEDENARSDRKSFNVSLTSGVCGIKYPDTLPQVRQSIEDMANELLSALMSRLEGGPWLWKCSDISFLKQTIMFQFPYDVLGNREDLEASVAKISERIHDPLDIAFGDIVFFTTPDHETKVGIYAGYGVVVTNKDCQYAGRHRLESGQNYQIYRILTGYAWTEFQVNNPQFLKKYVADSPQ